MISAAKNEARANVKGDALRDLMRMAGMPEQASRALVEAGTPCRLQKGQLLARRGEEVDGLFLILSGALGVISSGPGGDRFIISVMARGTLYGVISVIDGGPAANDMEALVPTRLWWIAGAKVKRMLRQDGEFRERLQSLVMARMRYFLETIGTLAERDVRIRVVSRLLHLASRVGAAASEIDLQQQVIAWFVGISRQRLNQELRRLAAEGLIVLRAGRIELVDHAGLARIAGDPATV